MAAAAYIEPVRYELSVGVSVELVIWRVPTPLRGSAHLFKYRLALIVDDVCVLRYDNEAGKGDHRHIGNREVPMISGTPTSCRSILGRGGQMAEAVRRMIVSVVPFEQMKDFSITTTRESLAAQAAGLRPVARRVFATDGLLWQTFTPKRLELLKAMGGRGPMSIREAARLVGRDIKAVHGEVQKMLEKGLIEKTEDGRIEFPYGEIHFDFVVRSEAAA